MNLSEIVTTELIRSPFITEAMDAGIVNTSSLARFIHPAVEERLREKVSFAAIGMAIKRLPISPEQQLNKTINSFMKQLGDITVRSDLTDYSFRNSKSLLQCQGEVFSYLESHQNYFYSFCTGVHETTIICSEAIDETINRIFKKQKLLTKRSDLAAVSINLPPTNLDTYGVYYTILKRLTWKGINLVEVLSTSHEISLIVSNEDVEDVFSIMLRLKKGR